MNSHYPRLLSCTRPLCFSQKTRTLLKPDTIHSHLLGPLIRSGNFVSFFGFNVVNDASKIFQLYWNIFRNVSEKILSQDQSCQLRMAFFFVAKMKQIKSAPHAIMYSKTHLTQLNKIYVVCCKSSSCYCIIVDS